MVGWRETASAHSRGDSFVASESQHYLSLLSLHVQLLARRKRHTNQLIRPNTFGPEDNQEVEASERRIERRSSLARRGSEKSAQVYIYFTSTQTLTHTHTIASL